MTHRCRFVSLAGLLFVAACGSTASVTACEPIVEDFMPLAQETVDAVDSGDLIAYEAVRAEIAALKQDSIDAGCPAGTMRDQVNDEVETLSAVTEGGQKAIGDLAENGPFGSESDAIATGSTTTIAPPTTLDAKPPTTSTTMVATTTTVQVIASLCELDVGEPLEEIFRVSPPPGTPGTAQTMGFDYCSWEVPGTGVVAIASLPADSVVPEEAKVVFTEFGFDSELYVQRTVATSFSEGNPMTLVVLGFVEFDDRNLDSALDQLHGAVAEYAG